MTIAFVVLLLTLGIVALSTHCKLIAPGVAVNGTMSITKTELYFEMDDEDAENKQLDHKVGQVDNSRGVASVNYNSFITLSLLSCLYIKLCLCVCQCV